MGILLIKTDLTKQRKYKIVFDESYQLETSERKTFDKWRYAEIPGRYGKVYPYSESLFAAYIKSPKIYTPIIRMKKHKIIQEGYMEIVFLFPPGDFDFFATEMKLRKKRQMSEKQRILASERLKKYHFSGKSTQIKATS